jgi:hypothetical protein
MSIISGLYTDNIPKYIKDAHIQVKNKIKREMEHKDLVTAMKQPQKQHCILLSVVIVYSVRS